MPVSQPTYRPSRWLIALAVGAAILGGLGGAAWTYLLLEVLACK